MIDRTKRHIWPVSLAAALAVVGVMAAFIVLSYAPGVAQAQGLCDTASGATLQALIDAGVCTADDGTDPGNGDGTNGNGDDPPAETKLESSSTSGGASIQLTLTIDAADMENLVAGDRIEIYLEDDYSVPDSISTSDVYFRVPGGGIAQNNGGRVNAADVSIDDSDHFTADKDDWAIAILVPDMDPRDDEFGYPVGNRDLIVVIEKDAGIKNPTEQGTHSNGYSILTGGESDNDGPEVTLAVLNTWAKISLSASDGGRGKEVTVTGSGFNNGTEAEVFVLVAPAVDEDATPAVMAPSCETIVDDGDSLGTAGVGSDDKFTVAFTVHQDEFDAGKVNFICAVDSEAGDPRSAMAVKTFTLTASISLDPTQADSGDEVTLKARDFGGALDSISLGPKKTWTADTTDTDAFSIKEIDGNDYTFDVPGGLSGVIQVDAKRGSTRKTANLTITPSSLTLSQTEVAPNQAVVISGSGFSDNASILTSNIKIDGKKLEVDDAGTEGSGDDRHVVTTSSGQFTATVNVWHDGAGNPALDADEYTIKVTDSGGYEGKTKITISEPTIMVTPQVAGPRDYIVISGANWPVTTSEDDYDVSIEVDGKTRSASIDSTGRFNYKYRLSGGIDIGKEHDIEVTFTSAHGDKIEEETTFSVPSSNVVITPEAAAPGETIDLEISGMPIGELVDEVTIDGGNRLGGTRLNTDRNGDVTIVGILVPYAEPGFYPVKIVVGTGGSKETAIVQLEILAEGTVAGVATAVGDALAEVGDNLVVVWHFNTVSKVWTFYDPRPAAAEFNTLSALTDGEAYQVLVSADVTGVVLNGKTRNLTCSGDNCWNQVVW